MATRVTREPIIASSGGDVQDEASLRRYGRCSHVTMTRLHSNSKYLKCCICDKPGSFGWLWRCTEDREALIEDDIDRGCQTDIDNIFHLIPKSNWPRKGSPELRSLTCWDVLDEMSHEERMSYSVDQLRLILRQRSNVKELIRRCELATYGDGSLLYPMVANARLKPWLPRTECQHKVCPACRPLYAERSFVSLNAVLNNDILPSLPTGFGFHIEGKRPVTKLETAINLGIRFSPEEETEFDFRSDFQLFPRSRSGSVWSFKTDITENDDGSIGDGSAYHPDVTEAFRMFYEMQNTGHQTLAETNKPLSATMSEKNKVYKLPQHLLNSPRKRPSPLSSSHLPMTSSY